jgi:maleylpyruvate isomerase
VPLVTGVLEDLADATASLIADARGLTDEQAREPSLLPGWTRGHVLTHLARNAEGGTRLLNWAHTGVPSYQYRSLEDRATAIEAGAGRPAVALVTDLRATAASFLQAAALMPAENWAHQVTWTSGHSGPAADVPPTRLVEVLIHHVDLNLGFGPADWPAAWTGEMLADVAAQLGEQEPGSPDARLKAADTGRSFRLGSGAGGSGEITGTEAELLAWLLGRSDGADLARNVPGPLPAVPSF